MFHIHSYVYKQRDFTLKSAFLASLEKLGVLATLGSLSLVTALSHSRGTAVRSDLTCSLGHGVTLVPYSFL